jgi:hypothetical protein
MDGLLADQPRQAAGGRPNGLDWEKHPDAIGEAVDELCARSDYDPSRPVIEFYRSHTELVIRVPVH